MSIKERGKTGIYWCDFTLASRLRVRKSLHTRNKAMAEQAEVKLKLEYLNKDELSNENELTLSQAFIHAYRARDNWRSSKSFRSIQCDYDAVVKHFGESCKLCAFTNDVILDYGDELFNSGLSASSINKRFSVISVLFDEAIKWSLYRGLKPRIFRYKVNGPRTRIITPEEETQAISILKKDKDNPYSLATADLVVVLSDTGMRLSEALKLRSIHFSPEQKSILVTDNRNGENRSLPLTKRSLGILQARAEPKVHATLLHPLTSASTASHIWRKVRTKMGLENDSGLLLCSFRNTFANTLANSGINSFVVKEAMGHKTIVSTERCVNITSESLKGLESVIEERVGTR